MLTEGRRRRDLGADVVIGLVETHGRTGTAERIGDLEVVPRRTLLHRGTTLEEMDIDAVLARRPEVALVDELAHTNAPGARHAKRWQDVEELLDAGIEVISTVNVQHLESVNDVLERITGVRQQETIPDEVVRRADQIELVDMSPEALRGRLAAGDVYPSERIDAALGNYFRPGNLGALREIALLWTADRVDDALRSYRELHGIEEPWETRERVVVAMTGEPGDEPLIRRAARMAVRSHGDLIGVHIVPQDGLATTAASERTRQVSHPARRHCSAGRILDSKNAVSGACANAPAQSTGRSSHRRIIPYHPNPFWGAFGVRYGRRPNALPKCITWVFGIGFRHRYDVSSINSMSQPADAPRSHSAESHRSQPQPPALSTRVPDRRALAYSRSSFSRPSR
jgi:K+-sensing histidine kinase KdpD